MSLGFILCNVFERTVAFWKYQIFSSGSCAHFYSPCTLGTEMSFFHSLWNAKASPCTQGASRGSAAGIQGRCSRRLPRERWYLPGEGNCYRWLWRSEQRDWADLSIHPGESTRRGNVFSWFLGRWPFAFCANYGCSSRWVLLYLSWGNQDSWHKVHGLHKTFVCEGVKSWPGWAIGTWVDFTGAQSRRKPLNLSLRCQRADGAITILGHHRSHRKCFLIFPKVPIQSQLGLLITSFFQVTNFLQPP